jgi:hypothetical protein
MRTEGGIFYKSGSETPFQSTIIPIKVKRTLREVLKIILFPIGKSLAKKKEGKYLFPDTS